MKFMFFYVARAWCAVFFMPRQHAMRPSNILELGVNNISRPFINCEEPDNYGAGRGKAKLSADFPAVRWESDGLWLAAELHGKLRDFVISPEVYVSPINY